MQRGFIPEPERTDLMRALDRMDLGGARVRAAVKAAHKAGGSIREISALTGKSTNTIQRWLREDNEQNPSFIQRL